MSFNHRCLNTCQVFQKHHVVITVWRQEMNFSTLRQSFYDYILQLVEWETFAHTDSFSQFFYAWLRSHPDYVVHIDIISEEIFFVIVYVNNSGISRVRMSEKI